MGNRMEVKADVLDDLMHDALNPHLAMTSAEKMEYGKFAKTTLDSKDSTAPKRSDYVDGASHEEALQAHYRHNVMDVEAWLIKKNPNEKRRLG